MGNLCANSTFVDPDEIPAKWHEFGELEDIGWAANAIGGAYEIIKYSRIFDDQRLNAIGISVLHHALEGGFIQDDGFVRPYRDISSDKRFINYMHNPKFENWFCPGSTGYIALQLLWASDEVQEPLRSRLRETALLVSDWLWENVTPCPNGWYPRRCTPDGSHANYKAWGDYPDDQCDHSGDGTYLLWLWVELSKRGLRDYKKEIRRAAEIYRNIGGAFGNINHDTYDDCENVALSVGYRCLSRAADYLNDNGLREWKERSHSRRGGVLWRHDVYPTVSKQHVHYRSNLVLSGESG